MTMIAKKFPTAALIDGEWVTSSKTFSVTDPATGAEVAAVPNLGAEDALRAIDAAAKALPAWSAKTAKERATILRSWFDLVTAETESLAQLMTTEQGKPLAESRAEVGYGASFIEWFAEEGKRAYGRTIPTTVASKRYLTIKQPIGVVAAIAPWNFPIAMITRKVAPALAAGCTIVVKPAAETPLCALAIAKLALDAGVPPGVLNIVTTKDAAAVGKVFCDDGRVRKLSFTGSTSVGKMLYRQCADTVKKLTLELGGNAPLVVFDDADLGQAVAGAMASKYRNAGQTCVCANRILVQSGIYDRFAAALIEAVNKLAVGPGMEAGTDDRPADQQGGDREGRDPCRRRRQGRAQKSSPAARSIRPARSSTAHPSWAMSPPTWRSCARRSSARSRRWCASTPRPMRSGSPTTRRSGSPPICSAGI